MIESSTYMVMSDTYMIIIMYEHVNLLNSLQDNIEKHK